MSHVALRTLASPRIGRRGFLAATAWGAAGTGALLSARPTRAAAAPAVVVAHLNLNLPYSRTLQTIVQDALEPLQRQHPGLVVKLSPDYNLWQGAAQASMLAGNGPDVFADWILDGYTETGLALDLAPFAKKDNIDLNRYEQGQLKYIRQAGLLAPGAPIALPALPEFTLPEAMSVNLGLLDDLGLKYPEEDWTYLEWQRLWEAATIPPGRGKPPRYGGEIGWEGYDHSYNMPASYIFYGFGGEFVQPGNQERCYLTSPGSLKCGEWAFHLIWENICPTNFGAYNLANTSAGTTACAILSSQSVFSVPRNYAGLKWDMYPLPKWPVVASTFTSTDSLGIWAGTRHPEAAWEVVKYLSYGLPWQRFQMRTMLAAPTLRELYEEYITILRQVEPILRTKNLELWVAQTQANQEYVGDLFRYSSDAVQTILGRYSTLLLQRKMTVPEAFAAISQQIDATEVAGKAESLQVTLAGKRYRHDIQAAAAAPATYRFPAPSLKGAGRPPVIAAPALKGPAPPWSLSGGGSGVNGIAEGLTFAGSPETAASGVFTCRLTAIHAVKPTMLHDGAKFGLMARADLSDDAANVGIEVAAGRGVHANSQPASGIEMGDQQAGGTPGLLQASEVLLPASHPAANFLTRPVWLRLVRKDGSWSPYTSLDGAHWLPAGITMGAEILGAWVGIFVTAHATGTVVSATFDHLSGFAPSTVVRIGPQ